jgi:uncharacterized protein YjeT (DUF2065 family)
MLNWNDLVAAFALYLVIEGMLPFLSPANWRKSLMLISGLKDGQLRFFGLASIGVGLGLLMFVRGQI